MQCAVGSSHAVHATRAHCGTVRRMLRVVVALLPCLSAPRILLPLLQLVLSSAGADGGGVDDLALPAMLERSALQEFASLPAAMGVAAAANRSAAVRSAQKRMKKKACKKNIRRVSCALGLAQAQAANGQHAAAVETAMQAVVGSKKGHLSNSLTEPFALFWLAQHAAHVGALSDPDTVLHQAAEMLFGRMRELQESPDLLNCVGLLEPQRRTQQLEACSNAVDRYCADDEHLGLLPCRVAHYWAGQLQLDSVVGSQLPDELSPQLPSDGWRNIQPHQHVTRLLSTGCASLATAVSGGVAEPALLLANYSCAALKAATESRRDNLVQSNPSSSPDFKPVLRIHVNPTAQDTAAGPKTGAQSATVGQTWKAVLEKGEPIVVTGSSALGLGGHVGWESIRTMCGHHPLAESEAAYLGVPTIDSVSNAATSVQSIRPDASLNEANQQLRLRDGLLATRKAVRNASLNGAPVGVSGWAVAGCPELAASIAWPELAGTARRARDDTSRKLPRNNEVIDPDDSDDSHVWGWSSARIYTCPQGSGSALHSDIHHSHHVLALLEGGPKEYVIFPADQRTRSRLLYNHIAGKFELGTLEGGTGAFNAMSPNIDNVSMHVDSSTLRQHSSGPLLGSSIECRV